MASLTDHDYFDPHGVLPVPHGEQGLEKYHVIADSLVGAVHAARKPSDMRRKIRPDRPFDYSPYTTVPFVRHELVAAAKGHMSSHFPITGDPDEGVNNELAHHLYGAVKEATYNELAHRAVDVAESEMQKDDAYKKLAQRMETSMDDDESDYIAPPSTDPQ